MTKSAKLGYDAIHLLPVLLLPLREFSLAAFWGLCDKFSMLDKKCTGVLTT